MLSNASGYRYPTNAVRDTEHRATKHYAFSSGNLQRSSRYISAAAVPSLLHRHRHLTQLLYSLWIFLGTVLMQHTVAPHLDCG